jgi:hypothetical protein
MELYSVLRHENHPLHKPIKKRKPQLKPTVAEERGETERFLHLILIFFIYLVRYNIFYMTIADLLHDNETWFSGSI